MTLAAAGFLLALAALGVPWWLHRRDHHGERRRPVSSTMLMRPAAEPMQPHRRVRHRRLLALRMGLLAALILAFAGPLLLRDAAAVGTAPVRPQLLVLDVSLSMQARFETAQRQARSVLAMLPAQAPAALVLAGADLQPATALELDRSALRAAIDAAEPGWTRLEFAGLLARLGVFASRLGSGPFDVHLISDLQQSAMPAQFNGLLPGPNAGIAQLQLHAVGGTAANWQVTAARQQDDLVATVQGYATAAVTRQVSLVSDDRTVSTRQVSVPAAGRAEVRWPLPKGTRADRGLRVEIDGADALPGDDRTFVAVRQGDSIPFTLLAPADSPQRRYFEAAVAAGNGGFHQAGETVEAPLMVVLDAGHLDPAQVRRMQRHLERGGGALMTAGPELSRSGVLALPPVAVENRQDPGGRPLREPGRSHPLAAAAAIGPDVTVERALAPDPAGPGETVLVLDDGTPLLVEYPVGAGRILLLTTALARDWSSLVASAEFVALIHEILGYLAEDSLPIAALAGERVAVPAGNVQVFDSAGGRRLTLGATVGRGIRIDEPGIYALRTPSRQGLLAVRPDPRESALAAAPRAWLARWQDAVEGPEAAASPASAATMPAALDLAPALLIVAAILLLLESAFANLLRPGASP